MMFVRVFTVVVILGAFAALGYAFWLTIEPLDAPPRGGSGQTAAAAGTVPAESVPVASITDDGPADTPAAAPEPRQDLVLDALREPIRHARATVQTARKVKRDVQHVGREVRRAGSAVADALPDTEDITAENAWRYVVQTRDELAQSLDTGHGARPGGHGRVHASGAPPYAGGGQPGTAHQPGMDWYKAGGQPVRE